MKERVLYVETVTVKRVMHYVWKHAFSYLTKTNCAEKKKMYYMWKRLL